ncbi:VWA domain-containing protein [Actinoallomurus purpureus]|uniref:VWA domain-containing protein n=1 Tax=Actinoallomurus purpureus TaxID=478114 RepID=UPI0020925A69|nr:VWA domain-containing protein [Actinoallomurus purpureus]MCO6007755.1 VWA domain-containing protein [Actinoallomurus purpureus]
MTIDPSPGDGSGRSKILRQLLEVVTNLWQLIIFLAPAAGIGAAVLLHHLDQISVALTWAIAVASSLSGLVVLATKKDTITKWLRKWAKHAWAALVGLGRSILACGLTAAVVAGVGWAATGTVAAMFGGSCSPPLDLRVLTAPENLTALRRVAAEYTTAGDTRCRPVRITVAASGSVLNVASGFQNGWYSAPGAGENGRGALQPDILVPASSGEADRLLAAPHPNVRLENEGSIGSSPLAVGISSSATGDLDNALAGRDRPRLGELLDAARRNGVQRIFRASPDVSEIGVLASVDLYAGGALGDPRSTERALGNATLPLSDSAALLCELRHRPASAERLAVIAPEQVLADYVHGRALGATCPAPGWGGPQLTIHRVSDTHTFDYPFIRVTWDGQSSTRRTHEIDAFRRWLGHGRLRSEAFRDAAGRPGTADSTGGSLNLGPAPPVTVRPYHRAEIDDALARFAQVRPPQHIALALDVSGSMSGGRSQGGSRFTYAVQLARTAAQTAIHDTDTVELDVFSRLQKQPPFRAVAPPGRRGAIGTALDGLTPQGSDIPLYDAIGDAAARVAAYPQAIVVVLTDGGSEAADPRGRATALRHALKTRPIVVLTGTDTCGRSASIKALGTAVRCVDAGGGREPNDVVTSVFDLTTQPGGG